MTYEQLTLPICLNANVTAEDFRASLLVLLESEEVSQIQEALYSLKSCDWLKSESLSIYSLKMSKDCSTMTGGATFETIIGTMAELGYGVEWEVLNSKNFGVPQNRERVFIIGHLGGPSRRAIFPLGTHDPETAQLQGQRDSNRIVSNTLDTRIEADTRGTYIADRQTDRQIYLKVNGYHKG